MSLDRESNGIEFDIKDQIDKSIKEISGHLADCEKQLEGVDENIEAILVLKKANKWICNDIKKFSEKPDTKSALIAISSVENINAQIACLESRFSLNFATNIKFPSIFNILNHIKNIIKRISSNLWQLISRLLTLESWSVIGGLTGGLFGMASGSVQLQLTFGK